MVGARPALKPPVDMAKRPELDRKKLVEAPQNHRKEAVSEKKQNILHTGGKPGSSWCQICVDFFGWCVFFGRERFYSWSCCPSRFETPFLGRNSRNKKEEQQKPKKCRGSDRQFWFFTSNEHCVMQQLALAFVKISRDWAQRIGRDEKTSGGGSSTTEGEFGKTAFQGLIWLPHAFPGVQEMVAATSVRKVLAKALTSQTNFCKSYIRAFFTAPIVKFLFI